jgi:hypothetical protein
MRLEQQLKPCSVAAKAAKWPLRGGWRHAANQRGRVVRSACLAPRLLDPIKAQHLKSLESAEREAGRRWECSLATVRCNNRSARKRQSRKGAFARCERAGRKGDAVCRSPGAGTALHACWLLKCICNSLRPCWLQMAGCGLGVRHHRIDHRPSHPRAPARCRCRCRCRCP